jgi:Iron-containing redox enzyme
LSRLIIDAFADRPVEWEQVLATAKMVATAGVVRDEDAQLSLLMLYELHYRGIAGVSDRWEWHPELLAVRAVLEDRFETEIRDLTEVWALPADGDIAGLLFRMTAPKPGPSLSKFLARHATIEQFREFLTHRSVYHLKEADPHTWAIPRLSGSVKAALVEVQADEYGGGREERMHAALFARTMRAVGMDDSYGALVDRVPGVVLAGVNAMSMFGLHRRLVGAIVGHLAAFEMTSSLPNRLYGNGLRRLGFGTDATLFFDEHVEADAVHEQIAGRDLAGGLAAADPSRAPDILFGAAASLMLDDLAGDHLRSCWDSGRTSLLPA